MGLYNFQNRFVPKILAGEKTHTIRALRAHPDKPGNTLHLYTGLRTKKAQLLMRVLCAKIEQIDIAEERGQFNVRIDDALLDFGECEALARRDGIQRLREHDGILERSPSLPRAHHPLEMPELRAPGSGALKMCERMVVDGTVMIICGGRHTKRCYYCSKPATSLCDWKVKEHKSGTCDRPCCDDHTVQVAPEKHLCQFHRGSYEHWKKSHPNAELPAAPGQLPLFGR